MIFREVDTNLVYFYDYKQVFKIVSFYICYDEERKRTTRVEQTSTTEGEMEQTSTTEGEMEQTSTTEGEMEQTSTVEGQGN
ncbi:MAG: hypothetical protein ACRCVL_01535 [Cetobacterium sp.]